MTVVFLAPKVEGNNNNEDCEKFTEILGLDVVEVLCESSLECFRQFKQQELRQIVRDCGLRQSRNPTIKELIETLSEDFRSLLVEKAKQLSSKSFQQLRTLVCEEDIYQSSNPTKAELVDVLLQQLGALYLFPLRSRKRLSWAKSSQKDDLQEKKACVPSGTRLLREKIPNDAFCPPSHPNEHPSFKDALSPGKEILIKASLLPPTPGLYELSFRFPESKHCLPVYLGSSGDPRIKANGVLRSRILQHLKLRSHLAVKIQHFLDRGMILCVRWWSFTGVATRNSNPQQRPMQVEEELLMKYDWMLNKIKNGSIRADSLPLQKWEKEQVESRRSHQIKMDDFFAVCHDFVNLWR